MPSQSNVTEGKKTASRLLAREINLTPGLLDALRPTGNPERELSTAEKSLLCSIGDPSAILLGVSHSKNVLSSSHHRLWSVMGRC